MSEIRKIAVVTGTRADYGLLTPLIRRVNDCNDLALSLIVTGMHLSSEFGRTRDLIAADGVQIDAEIEMLLSSDTPSGITKSLGLGIIGMADAVRDIAPDILVLLGDRFEILGAAQSAMIAGIPIAHIHGGEITQGAIDDPIRHAITKMAHLHFTSTEIYRRRVIQLGEAPERVFNVGAIGLDRIRSLEPMARSDLESELGFKLSEHFFLVTFHPETMEPDAGHGQLTALLRALDDFPDCKIVLTFPNADTHSGRIIEQLRTFADRQPGRVLLKQSLGDRVYLSALQLAEAVVGNSSSGIIEAPSMGAITVNIGGRQQGRVAAASVIHCAGQYEAIRDSICEARSSKFRATVRGAANPYDSGGAVDRILPVLRDVQLSGLVRKKFCDIEAFATP